MHGVLEGRVAVITGAARGIGREHARLMAAEGAAVVVNDLPSDHGSTSDMVDPAHEVVDLIQQAGGSAAAHLSDVSCSDGADELVEAALETFGRVDILVNNAGILRDRAIVNMSDDDWDDVMRVNLRGHFMPLRAAARHWRTAAKGGESIKASVVNTASESGVFANAGQANYAAAKSAVATLTEVASKELDRYGVRVNAILPRARTRLTEAIVPGPRPGQFDKWAAAAVAPYVVYLASEACQATGQVFLVGGGLVQRVASWSLDPDWKLVNDRRWTQDDLVAAVEAAGPPRHVDRLTGNIR